MTVQDKKVYLAGRFSTGSQKKVALLVQKAGGEVLRSLRKDTDLLLIGRNPGALLDKANKLDIPVLTEADFLASTETSDAGPGENKENEATTEQKQLEKALEAAVVTMPKALTGSTQRSFADPRFWHKEVVHKVQTLSDQKHIVSVAGDGLYLWDLDGGLLDKVEMTLGYSADDAIVVNDVQGKTFALLSSQNWYDCDVRVYSVGEGGLEERYYHQYKAYKNDNYYLQAALNGEHLFLGFSNHLDIHCWNDGTLLKTLPSPMKPSAENGCAVAANGSRAAFFEYESNKVQVISLPDGEELGAYNITNGHNAFGPTFQFSPKGTWLLTSYGHHYQTTIEAREPLTGVTQMELTNYSSNGGVMGFLCSSSEKYIIVRCAGVDLICWDLEDEQVKWVEQDMTLQAQAAFSGDKELWVTEGHRLIRFSLETGEKTTAFQGVSLPPTSLFMEPVSRSLLATVERQTWQLNLESGEWKEGILASEFIPFQGPELLMHYKPRFQSVVSKYNALTGMERVLFSGSFDFIDTSDQYILTGDGYFAQVKRKCLRLWSHAGTLLKELKGGAPETAVLLGDGETILGSKSTNLFQWDISSGKKIKTLKKVHKKKIEEIVVAEDKQTFATRSAKEIGFWKVGEDEPFVRFTPKKAQKTLWSLGSAGWWLGMDDKGAFSSFEVGSTVTQTVVYKAGFSPAAVSLRPDGMLYLADGGTLLETPALLQTDLPFATVQLGVVETGVFVDWDETTADNLEQRLSSAHWNEFEVERDLLPLRHHLREREKSKGLTPLHKEVSKLLLNLDVTRLMHQSAHSEELVALGLSDDGRYLATGTWVGENYEEGGTLQIWEVATGRCVNILNPIDGGVGWPGYGQMIRWSPDNKQVGIAHDTNCVGNFLPFEESSVSLTSIYVTNGWSRPPNWCWSPEGDAIMVSCWGTSEIPGCITKLDKSAVGEDNARWFAKKVPDEYRKENGEAEHIEPARWVRWSSDGARIYGHNNHSYAYSVDARTGQLEYFEYVFTPVAWCPDDEVFVDCKGGLSLRATATGEVLQELELHGGTVAGLSWAPVGNTRRLAVQVSDCKDFEGGEGVLVFEDEALLCSIPVVAGAPGDSWDWTDSDSLAWSLDGTHAAMLLPSGEVQVWSIQKEPVCVQSFDGSPVSAGLQWGADNVVILSAKEHLEFWNAFDAQKLHEYRLNDSISARAMLVPGTPSPLELKKEDLGRLFSPHPCVPMMVEDESEWVVGLPQGVLVAPESHREAMSSEWTLSVGRRFSWPLEWLAPMVYDSFAEAIEAGEELPFSSKHIKALSKKKKKKRKKPELALGKKGSLETLYSLHWKSVKDLHSGWDSHVSDQMREIAGWRARAGEVDKALEAAGRVPEHYQRLAAFGDVACFLFHQNKEKAAAQAFERAEKLLAKEDPGTWMYSYFYPPMAAAAALLGEQEKSNEYFRKARIKLNDESNKMQKYFNLARGYFLMKAWDKGFHVFAQADWSNESGWLNSYFKEAMFSLLREGEIVWAERFFHFGLEKELRYDDFELLDGFLEGYESNRKYLEGLRFIEHMDSLYTVPHETRFLQGLWDGGEVEAAMEELNKRLQKSSEWKKSQLEWVKVLLKWNPKATHPYLDEMLEARSEMQSSYGWSDFFVGLASTLFLAGRENEGQMVLEEMSAPESRISVYLNVADGSTDEKMEKHCLQEAETLWEDVDDSEKHSYAAKIALSWSKVGEEEIAQRFFERAQTAAIEGLGDRRFSLEEVKQQQLEANDLQGAYQSLRKQSASNRRYALPDLVMSCIKVGELGAAKQLLEELPCTDLNDRPSTAIRVLRYLNEQHTRHPYL